MSGGQQHTTHDTALGWIILSGIALALFALFWYFFSDLVKSAFRWWRWLEMWLLSFFIEDGHQITYTDSTGKVHSVDFYTWLDAIPNLDAAVLDGQTLAIISSLAMEPLKIPFVIMVGLMAFWAITRGPGTQYRNKYNLDGLIGAQSKMFPIISPFISFNPSNQPTRPPGSPVPAELPSFAEALGPEEWISYNQIPIPDGNLNERATYIAFARQLGPRWKGPLKLSPDRQVMLAAFCLKASRKRKESDDMMGRLALCWSHKKGLQLSKDKYLLKDARKVLRDRKLSGTVLASCNQHAFQTTAMLRALQTAREEGGVLASAQFVWLRAHDRALWYPLNNLGRQSFHIEALGAMCHFKAERRTQRPIPKPKVDGAITTITEYMASPRARPVPQLDYSGTKRGGVKKPKAGVKKPKKK